MSIHNVFYKNFTGYGHCFFSGKMYLSFLSNDTKTIKKSNLRSPFNVLDMDEHEKIGYGDLRSFNNEFSSLEEEAIGSMNSVAYSNKNGYVEYDEFKKVLNRRKDDERIGVMEDVFRAMDKDGDGKVGHKDLKRYDDVNSMIRLGCGDVNDGVTFEGLLKLLAF